MGLRTGSTRVFWMGAFAVMYLVAPTTESFGEEAPYLYVLGIAQDGGYPQAGCYEAHCLPAWNDAGLRRMPVSLALIDPGTGKKYMFEATPSFPEQLHDLEEDAPSDRYELSGIFLTHAHIGHYTGLMFLGHESMGASQVPVFALPRMREYLRASGPWSQLISYENITLMPLELEVAQRLGTLSVIPFRVPHREEFSEAVGFRIDGPNRSALFIPDIDNWSEWDVDLPDAVREVDYALIDATFYADGEIPGRDMSTFPHPRVVDSMALLAPLPPEERAKVWFIHLNHTNPLLNAESKESREVISNGFRIAAEGTRLPL